jgi:hypothetical protein
MVKPQEIPPACQGSRWHELSGPPMACALSNRWSQCPSSTSARYIPGHLNGITDKAMSMPPSPAPPWLCSPEVRDASGRHLTYTRGQPCSSQAPSASVWISIKTSQSSAIALDTQYSRRDVIFPPTSSKIAISFMCLRFRCTQSSKHTSHSAIPVVPST